MQVSVTVFVVTMYLFNIHASKQGLDQNLLLSFPAILPRLPQGNILVLRNHKKGEGGQKMAIFDYVQY